MGKRVKPGDSRIAVAYVRVSTSEQRNGPEAQRAAIEAWAAREGVDVAAWCTDQGLSGGKAVEARPGLLSAIAALSEHGAGILIVAKRDRVARDVVIAATVERVAADKGAIVVSAAGEGNGTDPASQFMRTVIDGAAAYERALIRARTKAALAAKASRGERVGAVPYGFRVAADGVRLESVIAEQATIATARALRADRSLREVAAALTRRGLFSRSGRPFAASQVQRMLSP
ncbi:MAG TPA: recombinase family protein [Polyangiaceae bacterium]|jgi:DNA invertase Pin-like site-specific DNA recombinase